MTMFLEPAEVAELTDRKFKSLQIKWLRENGVAFRISATGHPKVARSVIEGRAGSAATEKKAPWVPNVLRTG
jgi:hypothetical protein